MNVGLTNNINTYKPAVKTNNNTALNQKQSMVSFTGQDKEKPQVKLSVLPSLAKGFMQPIKDIVSAVIDAPLSSALILGVTAAGMRCSKLLGTALTVGICGFGAVKMGASSIKAVKAIKEEKAKDVTDRDYTKANHQIGEFGEGLFDVALTANSAVKDAVSLYNSAKAVAAAKTATIAQKVFGIVKQVETPEAIIELPKTSKGILNKFKKESVKEFGKLTDIVTGNSRGKTTKLSQEISELLKNTDANSSKESIINGLRSLSENLKDGSKTKGQINSLLESIGKEGITKLSATNIQQIDRILAGIESANELPGGVRVLREVMKSTNKADDVGKVITKYLKGVKESSEVTAKAGVASGLGEEDR
ncbi:MAG: hypothetical protein AB7V50_02620 [Vampirovibrionia bacterium]